MVRWSGRVALVTGASSGIGKETSRLLVKHGMIVVGCARNMEMMKHFEEELAGERGSFHPVQCDLSKRDQIYAMFDAIKAQHGGVDVCVNNAGTLHGTSLLDGTPDEWQDILDVNVIAVCLCTKLAVQQMRERGVDDGHIILMNSMGGHRVLPGFGAFHFYAGTKHMITALTEGYRAELRESKSHIRVSAVSPGLVGSDFVCRLYPEDPAKGHELLKKSAHLKSEDVAALVIVLLQQSANVQIHDILVRNTDQIG